MLSDLDPRLQELASALSPLNPWWEGRPRDRGRLIPAGYGEVERTALAELKSWYKRTDPSPIATVRGMRRSGKSTLVQQFCDALLESGVRGQDILWADFEHPVFGDAPSTTDLDDLMAIHAAIAGKGRRPWLLLDEIQRIEGWVRWVRAAQDAGRACVVATGSTSRLMAEDVAPVLTGRRRDFVVWPMSFAEFLSLRGHLAPDGITPFVPTGQGNVLVRAFLQAGGLPRAIAEPDEARRQEYLATLFDDILLRDVLLRQEVRRVADLRRLGVHYLKSTGSGVSVRRLMKSHGFAQGQVTDYTAYLERAFLVRFTLPFSFKIRREQERTPRKVYAVDTGMRNAVVFRHSADWGHLAETAVHTELLRRWAPGADLFHHQGARGCDFIVWRQGEPQEVIQVCYPAPDTLPEPELAGLLDALDAVRAHDEFVGTIITDRPLPEFGTLRRVGGRRVRIIPLWRWLLGQDAP